MYIDIKKNIVYIMLLVYLCFFSGVYLYFRILMCHKQFEIGCGATINKIYYYCYYYKLQNILTAQACFKDAGINCEFIRSMFAVTIITELS